MNRTDHAKRVTHTGSTGLGESRDFGSPKESRRTSTMPLRRLTATPPGLGSLVACQGELAREGTLVNSVLSKLVPVSLPEAATETGQPGHPSHCMSVTKRSDEPSARTMEANLQRVLSGSAIVSRAPRCAGSVRASRRSSIHP